MKIKIFILRIRRGLSYLLYYVFYEYPRGLDFSIRNKSADIFLHGNHGYALTSNKALKNMLANIPLTGKLFLDIGSGKGGGNLLCLSIGLPKICRR